MRKDMVTSAQVTKQQEPILYSLIQQLKQEVERYQKLKNEVFRYSVNLKRIDTKNDELSQPLMPEPFGVVENLNDQILNLARCNSELDEICEHLRLVIG